MIIFGVLLHQVASPTLSLDLSQPGIAVSPTLYGHMTEEINFSYDGGLYAELVRNRAFRDDTKKPAHWSAVGSNSTIELVRSDQSTSQILRVQGGVANEGYWGIPVRPQTTYRLTLDAKLDHEGPVTATIESTDGTTVYASATIDKLKTTFQSVSVTLKTDRRAKPTTNARLVLRAPDSNSLWLKHVSLFPPTFKNRPNGNRPDLMQMLIAMKPKFLRFPGGNYLEGTTLNDRFPWKQTLGAIADRPGHQGPWGYRSSDGMGLLEFLLWCEEMRAKPVLAVYAGYALNGQHIKPGPDLAPDVQDALDEIEYVIGDVKTPWGARRAKDGHARPFPLECVEVGNEDGFDKSGSYEDRFVQFYDAIKAKYPKLKVISTTGGKDWLGAKFPILKRTPDLWDEHYYAEAWDMMAMATKYDTYDRKGPKIFVGEWAAHDTVAPWVAGAKYGPTPNMRCTLADAAFMTGLERNSDVVEMACYAPLLVNVNPGGRQWSLNLIGYDALNAFGSPSYYAQRMFAENLGDRTVPLHLTGVPTQTQGKRTLPGLFASATRATKNGVIYVKLVNPLPTDQEISFDITGASISPEGQMTTLTGDLKAMNSLADPTLIAPTHRRLRNLGQAFRSTLPAHSIVVIQMQESRD